MKNIDKKKKYTIKEIAKLAGVSKGTVDRVLHKRGRVSEEANEKVNKILNQIDYRPNPIARNLKNNKTYIINVVLPDPRIDPFWIPSSEGIKTAEKEFEYFGIKINKFVYHPDSESSFAERSSEALSQKPDGFLIAPYFKQLSLNILDYCQNEGIVLSTFNNAIAGVSIDNSICQDLWKSGRVAACLIEKICSSEKRVRIGIVHFNAEPHMLEKEFGFRSYFSDKKSSFEIETLHFSIEQDDTFSDQIISHLSDIKSCDGFFITNSKSHFLVDVIVAHGLEKVVVGYDLIDENIHYLNNGKIDFLIHQKPFRQAYLGVYHLAESFLFEKPIPKNKLLPVDIVTTENLSDYIGNSN